MKKFLSSAFDNRWFVLALSFVLAVFCWALVVYNISTEMTREIKHVPVEIGQRDASYNSYGLHIVDETPVYVDVTVQGERSSVNALTADDIRVVPNYSQVTRAGTFTLTLDASGVNPQQTYKISSVAPGRVTLRFDVAMSERFQIEPEIDGLLIEEGMIGGAVNINPAEVTVSGPESDVMNIARAVVYAQLDGVLSEKQEMTLPVILYDAAGNEIPQDNLNLSAESVTVTIPVYIRGRLPLDIGFINVPDGFDVGTLDYTLSHTEIEVASDAATIGNLSAKTVAYIDLAKFEIGMTESFEISLPANMINVNEVNTVTVTFPRGDLSSARMQVSEIVLENVPENYEVEILTETLGNVTVLGPAEQLEQLLPGSVVAVVDFSKMQIERGEQTVMAEFIIPAYNDLWVAGSYAVLVAVTPV